MFGARFQFRYLLTDSINGIDDFCGLRLISTVHFRHIQIVPGAVFCEIVSGYFLGLFVESGIDAFGDHIGDVTVVRGLGVVFSRWYFETV